jgi:hypothetical protein
LSADQFIGKYQKIQVQYQVHPDYRRKWVTRGIRFLLESMHRKKSFSIFPPPAGMSLTKVSLGGNYDLIYKLFLPWESLVSDILAGDRNIEKPFFTVWIDL